MAERRISMYMENMKKSRHYTLYTLYGFIRANLFCQIGPLPRDRARILYLVILWYIRDQLRFRKNK